MLVPKGLSKSKLIVLVVVLAISLGMIGYLVFANFGSTTDGPALPLGEELSLPLPTPPLYAPDFFSQPMISTLQNNGALPLTVSASGVGNSNPFGATVEGQP